MATESAPSLVEWNSLSEDGQIKQQEGITEYLKEPDTLDKFKQDCRDVGRTAVAIDDGLRFVQRGFFQLAEKYAKDFPLVGEVYVTKWNGFMAVSNSALYDCPGMSLVHISVGKETQGSSGLQGTLRRRLRLR